MIDARARVRWRTCASDGFRIAGKKLYGNWYARIIAPTQYTVVHDTYTRSSCLHVVGFIVAQTRNEIWNATPVTTYGSRGGDSSKLPSNELPPLPFFDTCSRRDDTRMRPHRRWNPIKVLPSARSFTTFRLHFGQVRWAVGLTETEFTFIANNCART